MPLFDGSTLYNFMVGVSLAMLIIGAVWTVWEEWKRGGRKYLLRSGTV